MRSVEVDVTSFDAEVVERRIIPNLILDRVDVQVLVPAVDCVQEIAEDTRYVVALLAELARYLQDRLLERSHLDCLTRHIAHV